MTVRSIGDVPRELVTIDTEVKDLDRRDRERGEKIVELIQEARNLRIEVFSGRINKERRACNSRCKMVVMACAIGTIVVAALVVTGLFFLLLYNLNSESILYTTYKN
ncbi:MAG: hypothetical protein ACFFG0_46480 [Candidatus Thorarchaeota archaeon]